MHGARPTWHGAGASDQCQSLPCPAETLDALCPGATKSTIPREALYSMFINLREEKKTLNESYVMGRTLLRRRQRKCQCTKNTPDIMSVCKATPDKYSRVFVKLILTQKLIYPGIISFKTRGNKRWMNVNSRHTNEPSLRGETNTIQTRLAARCCTENRFRSTTHNISLSHRANTLLLSLSRERGGNIYLSGKF